MANSRRTVRTPLCYDECQDSNGKLGVPDLYIEKLFNNISADHSNLSNYMPLSPRMPERIEYKKLTMKPSGYSYGFTNIQKPVFLKKPPRISFVLTEEGKTMSDYSSIAVFHLYVINLMLTKEKPLMMRKQSNE